MPQIALGITGSVAAVRTPLLVDNLQKSGHTVRVIATEPSLRFVDSGKLRAILGDGTENSSGFFRDEDDWSRTRWEAGDPVLHIELRKWADLILVAPLDANTLAKCATGLADNLLTCVLRARDLSRPLVLAPAMNTAMWHHPVTLRNFRAILSDHGSDLGAHDVSLDRLDAAAIQSTKGLRIVPPIPKRLACGDVGLGAMAEVGTIVHAVNEILVQTGLAGSQNCFTFDSF